MSRDELIAECERLRAICMATPQGQAMLSSAFLKDGQLYIDTTCPALDVTGDHK
jgi:hypothetical protein